MTKKLVLSIPPPINLGKQRGLQGFEHAGCVKSIRLHVDDLVLIAEEAAALDVSSAQLIRWLAVFGCQQLHLQRTGKHIEVNP